VLINRLVKKVNDQFISITQQISHSFAQTVSDCQSYLEQQFTKNLGIID
jgi:hypothetical protein